MAMGPIRFELSLFRTPEDRERSQKVVLWLLEVLFKINEDWIRSREEQGKEVPLLYQSPVKWVIETEGEEWQDIPVTLAKGYGDCEDLAAWRGGELRARGIPVHPWIEWRTVNGALRYHALVRHPDGRIEDPSLAMGMRGKMYRRPMFIEASPKGMARDDWQNGKGKAEF